MRRLIVLLALLTPLYAQVADTGLWTQTGRGFLGNHPPAAATTYVNWNFVDQVLPDTATITTATLGTGGSFNTTADTCTATGETSYKMTKTISGANSGAVGLTIGFDGASLKNPAAANTNGVVIEFTLCFGDQATIDQLATASGKSTSGQIKLQLHRRIAGNTCTTLSSGCGYIEMGIGSEFNCGSDLLNTFKLMKDNGTAIIATSCTSGCTNVSHSCTDIVPQPGRNYTFRFLNKMETNCGRVMAWIDGSLMMSACPQTSPMGSTDTSQAYQFTLGFAFYQGLNDGTYNIYLTKRIVVADGWF